MQPDKDGKLNQKAKIGWLLDVAYSECISLKRFQSMAYRVAFNNDITQNQSNSH